MHADPARIEAGSAVDLLFPEQDYEGANLPIATSRSGAAKGPVHELRDPAWFRDADGKEYLLYSVAGEQGIAIAELRMKRRSP